MPIHQNGPNTCMFKTKPMMIKPTINWLDVEHHEKSMHLDRGGWIGLIKNFIHLTICVYTNKSLLSFIKGDWTKRFKHDDVYKLTQQGRIYDFQIKKMFKL